MKRNLCLIADALANFQLCFGPIARLFFGSDSLLLRSRRSVRVFKALLDARSDCCIVTTLADIWVISPTERIRDGRGSSGGGPGCVVLVVDIVVLGPALAKTVLGSPGMCFSAAEFPDLVPDERVGDIGVFCAPDPAASPCSGEAVAFSSVGEGSNLQFRNRFGGNDNRRCCR